MYTHVVENSSRDMIAAAISGDEGVFTKDEEKEEFRKDLEKFSQFLIDLLKFWLIDSKTLAEVKLVEAYFDCYNNMLNFKDEGKSFIIIILWLYAYCSSRVNSTLAGLILQ